LNNVQTWNVDRMSFDVTH